MMRHQLRLALALAAIAFPAVRAQQAPAGPPPRARTPDGDMRPRVRGTIMEHEGPGHQAGAMKMRGQGPGSIGGMLLAHTAELKLSDAQVTRLAAIARRTDERHKAARVTMDSVMKSHMAMPAAERNRMPMQDDAGVRAMHERMMAAERADVRDALAVLTADQQADAWMMRSPGMRMHGPM